MMKKLGILLLVLLIWSCSRKGEKDMGSASQRTEITPFKINKILLRDTQLIKSFYAEADSGRMTINEYIENWGRDYKFLDNTSFNALRKAIWTLVKNPESRVYINQFETPASAKEVKERVIACAMLEETSFDAEGNEVIQSRFNCDSMTTIRNINQIRFFESWYFNPETNMIERELLGYSVHEFVSDKNAFRELFDVFVNDAALQKARQYYFNKQAQ
jgi:hypothetical protein